ncbi:MAG: hypothetical protein ACJAWW_001498 [Sulfurimonas sp.]|jgi:hypothetical protein
MKYFTFVDKDHLAYTKKEIWDVVLDVKSWPLLWKYVVDITLYKDEKVSEGTKIDCYFTLYHLLNLHFNVSIETLKKEEFASFSIEGDFSGKGRWILKTENALSESELFLHLQTNHFLLKFISILPFGEKMVQYSHRRVMLEGKKMIIKKLSHV